VLEYDEALDKWAKSPSDFPLIVVLLEGQTAPGLPFLRRLHWIITPDPSSEKDVGRLFDAAAGGGTSQAGAAPGRHRGLCLVTLIGRASYRHSVCPAFSCVSLASDQLPLGPRQ
jgi:hypothetical protein